jgi:excisionase family DNA binding protein
MSTYSTRQAAKKLGLHVATLARYIAAGKVPAPKIVEAGGTTLHIWSEQDIERVRKLLPKIENGRKLRYQKQRKQPKK